MAGCEGQADSWAWSEHWYMALGVGAAVDVWLGDAVGWVAGGVVKRHGHGCVGEGMQTAHDMAPRAYRLSRAGCLWAEAR